MNEKRTQDSEAERVERDMRKEVAGPKAARLANSAFLLSLLLCTSLAAQEVVPADTAPPPHSGISPFVVVGGLAGSFGGAWAGSHIGFEADDHGSEDLGLFGAIYGGVAGAFIGTIVGTSLASAGSGGEPGPFSRRLRDAGAGFVMGALAGIAVGELTGDGSAGVYVYLSLQGLYPGFSNARW